MKEGYYEGPPPASPNPYQVYIPGKTYVGDAKGDYEVEGTEFAYWAHCQSGMTRSEFMVWLNGEFDTLEAIDEYCSK